MLIPQILKSEPRDRIGGRLLKAGRILSPSLWAEKYHNDRLFPPSAYLILEVPQLEGVPLA